MTFIVLYSLNVSLVLCPSSLDHFALLQGLMGLTVNHLVMPRREKVCGFYLVPLSICNISSSDLCFLDNDFYCTVLFKCFFSTSSC